MQGQPRITEPWGKLRTAERGGPAWHPLADHATDVACVLESLLAQPTIRRRLARAGGLDDLDEIQVARLCHLAFLHDLGKCCRGFRAKAAPGSALTCGHIRALGPLLKSELIDRLAEVLDLERLEDWFGNAAESMVRAMAAHHGKPVSLEFNPNQDPLLRDAWLTVDGDDPFVHLENLVRAADRIFPTAAHPAAALPDAPAFQHLYAGLLMLADWLGSDDADDMFRFSEEGDGPRDGFARVKATRVLGQVGLDPSPLRHSLAAGLPTFETQFPFPPRPMQREIETLPLPLDGDVVLVESETGSGKTEAALRHATRLHAEGLVDGVFFAVPLRSAAVQLHGRIQQWLERTFPDGPPEALLAVPGYLRMGEAEGRLLPDFAVQWTDDEVADRGSRRWAAVQPKRFAAAAFAVGTVDQALLAVLQTAHAHLRAACLVRHLLVIDEVHASDPYMQALVERLIALFRTAGGHVLLMSATLGAATRGRLLHGPGCPIPPPDQTANDPYPLISTSFGPPVTVGADGRVKQVRVELLPLLDDPDAVAERVAGAAEAGAKVLVLRNTVGAAIATQIALEERLGPDHPALFRTRDVATLHHGRFAAEDRMLIDAEVQARLGKDAPDRPLALVATQTVEQSLDVDADLLLTDLCPIDVLLQRIGRLHRHARDRPPGFEQSCCVVLGPAPDDLAPLMAAGRHNLGFRNRDEGYAYADLRAIEATRRLIGTGALWTIPEDNRRLVERGTHPAALDAIADELGGPWPQHGLSIKGIAIAWGAQARDVAIDFDTPFAKLHFCDLNAAVRTRLGLDDLLLPLEQPITSPFGATLERLKIPGWLVHKETWAALAAEAEPHIGVGPDGTLHLAGQNFTYGRHGLFVSA